MHFLNIKTVLFVFVVTVYSTGFFFFLVFLCASLLNAGETIVNKTHKDPLISSYSLMGKMEKKCIITRAAVCYEGNESVTLLRS